MPRKPINYDNAVVYKIVCRDVSIKDMYVGSTTDFTCRKSCHHYKSKTKDSKLYTFIRENGGWENFDMVLVEKVSCENSLELKKLERHYIETLRASLNTLIPSRSRDEYNKEHREQMREYERQ